MFQVEDLRYGIGEKQILDGVNFSIGDSEVAVILGGSGAGKTTIIRCLCGLIQPDSGRLRIDGNVLSRRKQHQLGFVPQGYSLFENMTALQNVSYGLRRVRGFSEKRANDRARQWFQRFALEQHESHYPTQLSGGQKQRVAIARALVMEPKALIFDEPTSALDPEMTAEVVQLIREVAQLGLTILIVSHDLMFSRGVSDRILFLDRGIILENEVTDTFFKTPKHPRAQQFLRNYLSQ